VYPYPYLSLCIPVYPYLSLRPRLFAFFGEIKGKKANKKEKGKFLGISSLIIRDNPYEMSSKSPPYAVK